MYCSSELQPNTVAWRQCATPNVLILVLTLAVALLLRMQHIADITMYFDECCSWKISQFPWAEMLDAISRDAHPPVYYVLMKGLGACIGDSPTVIRGFSVLFGLATIVATVWFVKTALAIDQCALGPDSAICSSSNLASDGQSHFACALSAALIAVSPLHVEMSLLGRPYTWGTFLTLSSATCLLRGLRPWGTGLDWLGFAVTATLLSLTHYYCLFTVATEILFAAGVIAAGVWNFGWNASMRRMLVGLGLSVGVVQLVWTLWFPIFLFQRERSTSQLWLGPLSWDDVFTSSWSALAGGHTSSVPEAWSWLAVEVWGAVVVVLFTIGTRGERLIALCAGVPLAATVVYCLAVRNILGAKYLVFCQIFVLIALSTLISRLRWWPARILMTGAVLTWSTYWCWQFAESRAYQASFPGIRGAAAYLDERRHPDEPVIVAKPIASIVIQKYSAHPQGIYVRYGGDHRDSILEGPPLRDDDYRDVDSHLTAGTERAWWIDVRRGSESQFQPGLPRAWTLVLKQA